MKRIALWGALVVALSLVNYHHSAQPTHQPTTTKPAEIQQAEPLVQAAPPKVELVAPVPTEVQASINREVPTTNTVAPKPTPVKVADPSLQLINQTRADKGLNQLSVSQTLMASTAAKCAHMVEHDYWAHSGGGREWASFIGGRYIQAGEILATGWNTNTAQHQAWLDSPTHYAQIVNDFRQFGIARCNYKDGRSLTVVHFWR